jgi:hypothetical protein
LIGGKLAIAGGKFVDTPIGPVWVPNGWRLFVSKPHYSNILGKDPGKLVDYKVEITPPWDPRVKAWKRRKRRRRRHSVSVIGSRYRERDLNSGTYLIARGDSKLSTTSVLGKLSMYDNSKKMLGIGGDLTSGDLSASVSRQATYDEVHHGPPFRAGGPFKTVIVHLPASKRVGRGRYTNEGRPGYAAGHFGEYVGSFADNGFWVGDSYATLNSKTVTNLANLSQYHSLAWDKTKPQIPQANLAQFVYELRDLPGMLKTSAEAFSLQWGNLITRGKRGGLPIVEMAPREAADHFVNHQFGWAPFIGDLAKLYDVFNHTVEHISRLVRDNGRYVRRRRVLEQSDETTSPITPGVDSGTVPSSEMRDPLGFPMCNLYSTPNGSARGYCSFTKRTRKRVWAVGSFAYFRPEFDPANFSEGAFAQFQNVQRLMTLYGVRINPTLLWKLTPWSWMADWFTNFGHHIERLDDWVTDGINARYLYVMKTEESFMTKTCHLNFYSGLVTLNFQRRLITKQREAADSPYGFNTPWNSLSPRQWAILGAIGFSRSPRGFISRGA